MTALALISVTLFAFALISRRLSSTIVSGPMVFMGIGILCEATGATKLSVEGGSSFHLAHVGLTVVELALAVTLFTDAARIDISSVRRRPDLPARLLGIGLPLTIAVGLGVASLLLTRLSIWEAALIAVVLAPTDAALGQAVVSDERIPARIRQALNVESGLNDGIAIWFLTLFLVLAGSSELGAARDWALFAVEQLGLGTLAGAAVGIVGGRLLKLASSRGWATQTFQPLAVMSLAVIAYGSAVAISGNGFIAAFVAGGAVGSTLKGSVETVLEFAEEEGQMVNLAVFFLFGALAWDLLGDITWQIVLYACLSLTLVRVLPVAISLLGTGLRARTVLFIGWFGPRGLASIAYALLILSEEKHLPGGPEIVLVMTVTVLLSVVAHGASAAPLSARYGRWCGALPSNAPEYGEAGEHATRLQVQA